MAIATSDWYHHHISQIDSRSVSVTKQQKLLLTNWDSDEPYWKGGVKKQARKVVVHGELLWSTMMKGVASKMKIFWTNFIQALAELFRSRSTCPSNTCLGGLCFSSYHVVWNYWYSPLPPIIFQIFGPIICPLSS